MTCNAVLSRMPIRAPITLRDGWRKVICIRLPDKRSLFVINTKFYTSVFTKFSLQILYKFRVKLWLRKAKKKPPTQGIEPRL